MKRRLAVLCAALMLALFGARAADGPYVFGSTQYGPSVDVRLCAPDGGVLVLGVYDRAGGALTGIKTLDVPPDAERQVIHAEFETAPASTESVTAFLLEPDTLRPLCKSVQSDVVIWSGDGDLGDDDAPNPEEEEEIPTEPGEPDTPTESEEPDTPTEPEEPDTPTERETEPENRTLYVTKTGKKYHYDPNCNGGTYYPADWEEIQRRGLEPCQKCVH